MCAREINMGAFRYQAVESGGSAVSGVIEAEDRKAALRVLSTRGIFASHIEACANGEVSKGVEKSAKAAPLQIGGRIRRKEVTAFTRELAALLGASIPIPTALEGLGEQEDNPAFRALILQISESVRKGSSLSAAARPMR